MSREAADRLFARIAAAKAEDPLRPATVVVPNHYVGLWLRRELAQRSYVNVRFVVLAQLAEMIGTPALAAAGHTPLTTATQEAAIREAIHQSGADFGGAAEHPSLAPTLRSLFLELRRRDFDPAALSDLAGRSRMARAAIAVFDAYLVLVRERGLYDERDILNAATADVTSGRADRLLAEAGVVHLHLLPEQSASELRFLQAVSARVLIEHIDVASDGGPGDVTVVVAPDADEEIRGVVRQVLADLEAGTPLHRVAILYRLTDPYGRLVRETLDAAGLPWVGLDGRPVAESRAGRALLGILRLPEVDFARADVISVLGMLPHASLRDVSLGQWDRLSRQAGVIHGAGQWRDRLEWVAAEKRKAVQGLEHVEGGEGRLAYERHQQRDAERMSAFITELAQRTRPPVDHSWQSLTDWAARLRRDLVPVERGWTAADEEAAQLVDEVVEELAAASAVEDTTTPAAFCAALAATLQRRGQPEGRLGSGVVVGTTTAAVGMAFDRVHLVGVTERGFPAALPVDPFFPPEGGADPLDRRRQHLAEERRGWIGALAAPAGGCCRLSFPVWDADLRPQYPSPWLVDLASRLDGRRVTAGWLRQPDARPWLVRILSPEHGLTKSPAPLNLAERRSMVAAQWRSRLRRSPLARRAELSLDRQLEARTARASDQFTPFDGNLAELASRSPSLTEGLVQTPVSPTAVQAWAVCPFSYLLDRILHVEATERPEQDVAWAIDPLARGTLIHEVLRRFFAGAAEAGRLRHLESWTGADRVRLDAIAQDEFAALEAQGRTGYRLAWDNEREAILTDLQLFLTKDSALRAAGACPSFLEQGFGFDQPDSWPGPLIELPDGRRIRLRGRIDRLDLYPDAAQPSRAMVLDYKTGRAYDQREIDHDPVVAGTRAQLGAYSMAVRARYPAIHEVTSAYWFVTSGGRFTLVTVGVDPASRLSEVLGVVDQGIRAGGFPQVPGGETERPDRSSWDNCVYCPFDRVCPTGRDQLWQRKRDRHGAAIHGELRLESAGD